MTEISNYGAVTPLPSFGMGAATAWQAVVETAVENDEDRDPYIQALGERGVLESIETTHDRAEAGDIETVPVADFVAEARRRLNR